MTGLLNLGLGGRALLDPVVARVIRDTSADLISLEIGINLVNTDLIRLRAFVPTDSSTRFLKVTRTRRC